MPLEKPRRRELSKLVPTMFSVTNTGMNFFPLCTANVSPIMSGITVDRRDQVLMIFLSFVWFICSTFLSNVRRQTDLWRLNGAWIRSYFRREIMNLSVALFIRVL